MTYVIYGSEDTGYRVTNKRNYWAYIQDANKIQRFPVGWSYLKCVDCVMSFLMREGDQLENAYELII